MRQSYTAVVERALPISGDFETEPYEAGWAGEALVFFKVRDGLQDGDRIDARIQISPNGIDWSDEGTTLPEILHEGVFFARVREFGNWLRVVGEVNGPSSVSVSIYFSLKA